ncbi:cytochrome c oxidase assembly protein [Amycolatopsis roodepoortensis]|uniref:cytochrome c oxidase assembly protein n=1 Tax=Amycolatopsis roodepoortensis TaxID=700274 RepID=UPI00214B6BB4|nr:cytochrome c oxidase assembly protein [Amycolatopsis roodepoortensis]UUV35868.1 cytochrome c oxidase assembly protein [Amycolatopsis roodepoortensis]
MNDRSLPPLNWSAAVTEWVWAPVPVVLILILGIWYGRGVRKLWRAGQAWPTVRIVWWYTGLGTYALVTLSAIGAYQSMLFSIRAIQVTTLLMITPQFLAHALPGRLARDTVSAATRARLSGILHSRTSRVITHPMVGAVVLLGTPIALYGSGWYEASLQNPILNEVTQLILLLAGGHYFWTRLQRDPVPELYPHYVSVALTFAEVALDVVIPLGLLMSGTLVAADYYLGLNGAGGLSVETDQATGAAVLWGLGDLALVPFLILSLNQLRRRESAHAAEIDRELDERQRAESGSIGKDRPLPATMRPWWEDDPDLASRFKPAPPDRKTRRPRP